MTASLVTALVALTPERFGSAPVSVARIETTRPMYLLFGTDANQPVCVAHTGPCDELGRLHRIQSTLHARLGALVPASLACAPWGEDGECVHLQAGAAGTPWFHLSTAVRTPAGWRDLEVRAGAALELLHDAIQLSPEWCRVVYPAEALQSQATRLLAHDDRWSPAVPPALAAAANRLSELGGMPWFAQHGDYCVNNLLAAPDRLTIIDFEEFDGTAMPAHDQFSLALSIHDFSSACGDQGGVGPHIARCLAPMLARAPHLAACLDGLFLHHLVWRINQCEGRPTRSAMRARLAALLEAAVQTPRAFTGAGPA